MNVTLFDDDGRPMIVVDPDGNMPDEAARGLANAILGLVVAADAIAEALDEATDGGLRKRQLGKFYPHTISSATVEALRRALDAISGVRGVR